ncbi:hypothetical protein FGIG_11019 [Fasciola gigantica]|uniref:Enkurin domain-containing protein n=1 Tax=Fasciola gigantica TaxID=46835 RepID=A0A504YD50_FASGI|nr:hypothetical protein FGIG_11019 [Fasciola gigantica]
MTSWISGPISSHNPYLSPRRSVYSSRAMPAGSVVHSENRPTGSLNALDLLQWQSKPSSHETSNISQTHGTGLENSYDAQPSSTSKNFIRENIRRLRRIQATPTPRRFPYAASFVPMAKPYLSISGSSRVVNSLPPRPQTAAPNFTSQTFSDFHVPQTKNVNTDTRSEPYLADCTECEFHDHKDHLNPFTPTPSRFVDRPTSPIRRPTKSLESVGVQYQKCHSSSESLDEKSMHSKAVQAFPDPVQITDPVSTEFNRRPEQSKQHKGRMTTRTVHRRARPASAGPVGRHDYMRAHAKTIDGDWNLKVLSTLPLRTVNRSPSRGRLSVPKASSAKSVHLIRRDINYIRANAHMATTTPPRAGRAHSVTGSRASTPQTTEETRHSFSPGSSSGPGGDAFKHMWPERRLPIGSLPAYLIKRRQEQLAAAARAVADEPDPDQPPGHHKMSESERKETLDLLQKAHRELSDEWSRLPNPNGHYSHPYQEGRIGAQVVRLGASDQYF